MSCQQAIKVLLEKEYIERIDGSTDTFAYIYGLKTFKLFDLRRIFILVITRFFPHFHILALYLMHLTSCL